MAELKDSSEGSETFEALVTFWGKSYTLQLVRTDDEDDRGVVITTSIEEAQSVLISLTLSDMELEALGHELPDTHLLTEVVWRQLVNQLSLISTEEGTSIVFCPEQGLASSDTVLTGASVPPDQPLAETDVSRISVNNDNHLSGLQSGQETGEIDDSHELSRLYDSLMRDDHLIPKTSQSNNSSIAPQRTVENLEFMLNESKSENVQLQRQVGLRNKDIYIYIYIHV